MNRIPEKTTGVATSPASAATTTTSKGKTAARPLLSDAVSRSSYEAAPRQSVVSAPANAGPQIKTPKAGGAALSPLALQMLAKSADPAALQALLGDLATPEGKKLAGAQVEKLALQLLNDGPSTPAQAQLEQELLALVIKLSAAGELESVLLPLAMKAWQAKQLPAANEEEVQVLVKQLVVMIDTQLRAHGLTADSQGTTYVTWDELAKTQLARVRAETTPVSAPAFRTQLEKILGQKFVPADVTLITKGKDSYAERARMMSGAKHSINLMTWAFYDDAAGRGTRDLLLAAKARGVDIKIMVDAEVAKEPIHHGVLDELAQAGIPVVRVPSHHRKVMVVDGQEAITGGMNIGDVYLHQGVAAEDPKQQWRDTDMLLAGGAVEQASALLARLWNEQVAQQSLPHAAMVQESVADATAGKALAAVVDDVAGSKDQDPIFTGMLKAIDSAERSVDIENAYFILNPAMRDALAAAIKRGVVVRVLSNSAESVDVPMISAPILSSLAEVTALGAKAYLKTGATLHSKFMVVDDQVVTVGSYNLHPQSLRYKGETNTFVLDSAFAAEARAAFDADLALAKAVERPEDISVPKNIMTLLVDKFFYDFL